MNYHILVFLLALQATSFVCATSFGRYHSAAVNLKINERHKRMHKESTLAEDCMFNICQHVAGYPETQVTNIIRKHKVLHTYFGGNIIAPSPDLAPSPKKFDDGLTPLCKTKDVSVKPRGMTDVDGVQRYIANVGDYAQVLTYQICSFQKENDKSCYPGNTLNVITECLQKFNDIKLVTTNLEQDTLEYHKFRIPSTCVCTYTKTE